MTLLVDFNMMDAHGRILALVDPSQRPFVRVGDVVALTDDEGNQSEGTVEKLRRAAHGPQSVAHVALGRRAAGPAADDPAGRRRSKGSQTSSPPASPRPYFLSRFHRFPSPNGGWTAFSTDLSLH
ncbi:MAG: hypothetical protein M3323_11505 [Actinomycetota bacterium]|nr:hypothetical protein [Actinomycetota bacterium]